MSILLFGLLFLMNGLLYSEEDIRDTHPGWHFKVRTASATSGVTSYQGGDWVLSTQVLNPATDYATEGTLIENKGFNKTISTLTAVLNQKVVVCDTNSVKTSSPSARVTSYSPYTEVHYWTSRVWDQSYGQGVQLGAGATVYWTIFDGSQTKDYYLKTLCVYSEASLVWLILYKGGDGATDFFNLAFNQALYVTQSSTYHKNFFYPLDGILIKAGEVLRITASNTSTSAGDLVLGCIYVERVH